MTETLGAEYHYTQNHPNAHLYFNEDNVVYEGFPVLLKREIKGTRPLQSVTQGKKAMADESLTMFPYYVMPN